MLPKTIPENDIIGLLTEIFQHFNLKKADLREKLDDVVLACMLHIDDETLKKSNNKMILAVVHNVRKRKQLASVNIPSTSGENVGVSRSRQTNFPELDIDN